MFFLRDVLILSGKHPFVPDVTSWGHHERYILAGNSTTSLKELDQLSMDTSVSVRKRVAENPNTPVGVLERLAVDPHWDVRLSVAENPNVPSPLVFALSLDQHDDVRYALAESYKTPVHILQSLTADDNPYVASRAFQTLSVTQSALGCAA